ncbi:MAG: hypothetical protein ABIP02_10350 [Arenimonas sp.]
MLHKVVMSLAFISLLSASGSSCIAGESNPSLANAASAHAEKPLSYDGQLAVYVAQELIQQKNYPEALKQADNAIRFDGKAGIPYMVKAFILDRQGKTKEAASAYANAIKRSPSNGYIRNAFGNHLCVQKDYSQAEVNFLLAVQDTNYPLPSQAYENAAQCAFQNNDLIKSELHAREALAINADSTSALSTMTQIKFKQSNFFEARAFIQRLESLAPLDASQLQAAIQIEKSAGDDRAAAQYQKKLDIVMQSQIQPPTGEGQKKP